MSHHVARDDERDRAIASSEVVTSRIDQSESEEYYNRQTNDTWRKLVDINAIAR